MTSLQRRILWLGLFLLVVMVLFPPWVQTYSHVQVGYARVPAKYAFIMKPPAPQNAGPYYGVELDLTRLLLQVALIVIAGGGVIWSLNGPKKG